MVWSLLFQNDDIMVENVFNFSGRCESRRDIYVLYTIITNQTLQQK